MRKYKIVIYAAIALTMAGIFFSLLRKETETGQPPKAADVLASRPDATAVVVVKKKVVSVADKTGKTSTKYVPSEGHATIVVTDSGKAELKVKNKGVSFTPGVAPVIDERADIRVGLTFKVAYWSRLSLDVGVLFGKSPVFSPAIGVGYEPGWRFENTAIIAGSDLKGRIFTGIVVRF